MGSVAPNSTCGNEIRSMFDSSIIEREEPFITGALVCIDIIGHNPRVITSIGLSAKVQRLSNNSFDVCLYTQNVEEFNSSLLCSCANLLTVSRVVRDMIVCPNQDSSCSSRNIRTFMRNSNFSDRVRFY